MKPESSQTSTKAKDDERSGAPKLELRVAKLATTIRTSLRGGTNGNPDTQY